MQKREVLKLQIFGSNISEPAIAKAGAGFYSRSEMDGATLHHQKEFFIKSDNVYKISRQLMDSCVFAVHNFLKDRSFGKPDFICCCTVPIYMEPHLQKKALTTLHYALNKNLFLLPGKCETISSVSELFELTHKGDKIFSLKDVPAK